MLGTIVIDSFKNSEKKEIADSLKIICNPINNDDWSSAGIYCFWNNTTKEVYYIGLATDLYNRFLQHMGLTSAVEKNCKKSEVDLYFKSNEKLGFTIILQSCLSQPITSKVKRKYKKVFDNEGINYMENWTEGTSSIKYLEGQLIESFRLANNNFPKWNKVGGSIAGQTRVQGTTPMLIKLLTELEPHKYISRASIRELAGNPTFNRYESYLHSIRISILTTEQTIDMHKNMFGMDTFSEIGQSGYFKKTLIL